MFIVTEVEDGLVRRIKARRLDRTPPAPWLPARLARPQSPPIRAGRPHVLFLDLPSRTASGAPQDQLRVAVWQKPWRSQAVLASPETTGFAARATVPLPADLGTLVTPLAPGSCSGRVHRAGTIDVALFDAEAASVSRLQLLNGANAAAIRSAIGVWEIVQFETADEFAPGLWRLSGLLRGQLGTDDAMAAGAAAGADIVILNDRVDACRPAAPARSACRSTGASARRAANFRRRILPRSPATGGLRARLPLSPVHLTMPHGWPATSRCPGSGAAGSTPTTGRRATSRSARNARNTRSTSRRRAARWCAAPTVTAQAYTYAAAAIAADFGALPAELDVTVRQFIARRRLGHPRHAALHLLTQAAESAPQPTCLSDSTRKEFSP